MSEDWTAIAAEVREALGEVGNSLTLTRSTPGTPDPSQPWVPVAPTLVTETVSQFGDGRRDFRSGEVVIASDFQFMIAVPLTITPKPGDMIAADGVNATIIKAEPFPAGGEPVYFTLWANL